MTRANPLDSYGSVAFRERTPPYVMNETVKSIRREFDRPERHVYTAIHRQYLRRTRNSVTELSTRSPELSSPVAVVQRHGTVFSAHPYTSPCGNNVCSRHTPLEQSARTSSTLFHDVFDVVVTRRACAIYWTSGRPSGDRRAFVIIICRLYLYCLSSSHYDFLIIIVIFK